MVEKSILCCQSLMSTFPPFYLFSVQNARYHVLLGYIFCLIEPFSSTSYSHNLVRLNEQLLIHSIIEPNGRCNTRTFLLPK